MFELFSKFERDYRTKHTNTIEDITQMVFNAMSDINSLITSRSLDKENMIERGIVPEVAEMMSKYSNRYHDPISSVYINIHGLPSINETDFDKNMQYFRVTDVDGGNGFDVDKAILICTHRHSIVVDVNCIIIELLENGKYSKDRSIFVEEIANVIKRKIIKSIFTCIFFEKNGEVDPQGLTSYNVVRKTLINYMMVNGLTDIGYDEVREKLRTVNTYLMQGNVLASSIDAIFSSISTSYIIPRFDQRLRTVYDAGKFWDAIQIETKYLPSERSGMIVNESVCLGDMIAYDSIIGMENVKHDDPKFAEYKRKTRMKLLMQLRGDERTRYVKLENELMQLKGEVMNVHTPEAKKVILKKIGMMGDIINVEVNRSRITDTMRDLLTLLDDDRYEMQSQLSGRDIVKERNTRLYGQLKTTNRWDY